MKLSMRFKDPTIHAKLDALLVGQTTITRKLDTLMSREAELEALVAQNTESLNTLGTEVAELKTAGNGAIARLRELIAAQTAAIEALTAEVAAAREGAVSLEALAALQATTDANVAAAAAAKADADAAEGEWDAVAQPEPPVA